LGVATVIPAGSVSVKATPVSELPAFGLVMVKLKLVVPFSGMVAAPKDLAMLEGLSRLGLRRLYFPCRRWWKNRPVVLL